MKIYNEIVFDVDGNVVYEDSYEYSGDLMLCVVRIPNITDLYAGMKEERKDQVWDAIMNSTAIEMNPEAAKTFGNVGGDFIQTEAPSPVVANPLPSIPSIFKLDSLPFPKSSMLA